MKSKAVATFSLAALLLGGVAVFAQDQLQENMLAKNDQTTAASEEKAIGKKRVSKKNQKDSKKPAQTAKTAQTARN